MSLKNFSKGSVRSFGGLYRTLIKVFLFLIFFLKVILHHCYLYVSLVEASSLPIFLYKLKRHLLFHNF